MSSGIKKSFQLFSIAFVAVFMAACNAGAGNAPAFPTGTFVSEASQDLEYRFNQNKTWSYHAFGLTGAEGEYSVKGNVWTEQGTEECPFPGSYEWTFDGSRLSFKLVGKDKCQPRREATDGQTFVLDE